MQLNRFRLRSVAALASLVFVVNTAWAVNPFTVRDIRIEGLQRVEPGTIFVSLPVRVGDVYNDEKGSAAIRTLFALGLFKDVRIEVSGDVLVIVVQERPTVANIEFVGTKEFDKEVLTKAMREVGLADGRPFDKAQLDQAEQELKRQYINRSLYAADVVTTVTPVDRNRVNLTFTVVEGDVAKISEIRIVGNKAFSESTLRNLFDLDTGGMLSWYTKSNRYSRAKLNADIESLRSYYLTRGYLEFKVDSTQVAILPNKTDIAITINVSEGERFVVSGVKLNGNYLGKEDEFKSLITIRPGQAYNADEVATTTKAFVDYFGNFGFAFAQVQARPAIDRSNNSVSLVLQADPSRRAYVRRINVAGNDRSRDVVVRREFRQLEASWYDGDKIKLSRDRVDRLGFFSQVDIETLEVPGAPDMVDLNITVIEKPTGSLSLGAGLSSGEGIGFSFGLQQENAFGSGNSLGVQLNTSKFNRVIDFSTTDPYFTDDGVSRTMSVFYRTNRPFDDEDSYKLVTSGGSMRFGVPFTETDTIFFGAGIERTRIVPGLSLPTSFQRFIDERGESNTTFPLTIGWGRDKRDSALAPNSGTLQRANAEWSAVGDIRYVRATYQYQQFIPLNKQFTVAFNGEIGWGVSSGGGSFPVFKRFFGGGLGSVRGFEQGSLGPRDTDGTAEGGSRKLTLNAELLTPFPGAGNDRTLRMFAFVDAGSISGSDALNPNASSLRSSAGVGLSWISPVGPLRLAYAKPIKKFDGDKIQTVQFQIGTTF